MEVVITDLIMPTLGGRELVERVRSLRPEMAIVVMSGHSPTDAEEKLGRLAREVRFLQKPWTVAELAAKIREALEVGR